jgi:hypothetical protein
MPNDRGKSHRGLPPRSPPAGQVAEKVACIKQAFQTIIRSSSKTVQGEARQGLTLPDPRNGLRVPPAGGVFALAFGKGD